MSTSEVDPAGVTTVGKTKIGVFVGALATPGAVSLASDIGHAGFQNISYYLPGGPLDWNPQVTQNKFADPRAGSPVSFESLGVATWTLPPISWIVDPTAAPTGLPAALLVENNLVTIIARFGLLASTDWVASQKGVWAWYALVGKVSMSQSQTGEGGKYTMMAQLANQTTAAENVTIAA